MRIACLALLVFVLSGKQAQAFPLWGNLEPGPYAVGYRTVFTYDLSRPPIADTASSELPSAHLPGRQMQISIWYPAKKLSRSSYLRFADYVSLGSKELNFSAFTEEQLRQNQKKFMEQPLARGASRQQLEALLRMQTAASKNAPPANGRFPLVVFAHSSPPNQSIMCEYLASHGFVIAAVPSKGSFEYDFDVGLSGLETLIKDSEFVAGFLKKDSAVDGQNLALIGMSFGSAGVVGLATRNAQVRAMISLDGGIGEGGVSFLLTRTPYYDVSRIKAPLLHLYTNSNPHLDLSRLNSYKYSTRYFIQIPRMRHGDFVAFGMMEQVVPKMFGDPPGDAKVGFEWVCRYSLRFLQAYLKNDAQGRAFLEQPAERTGVPKDLLSITIRPRLPDPPTTRELKAIFQSDGIKGLVNIYRGRKSLDAQPFTLQSFIEVSDWLLAIKKYDADIEFCRLFVDSYPESVRAHYAFAVAAKQVGDTENSKHHFQEVLRLINDDPDLDYRTKQRLKQVASESLMKLP